MFSSRRKSANTKRLSEIGTSARPRFPPLRRIRRLVTLPAKKKASNEATRQNTKQESSITAFYRTILLNMEIIGQSHPDLRVDKRRSAKRVSDPLRARNPLHSLRQESHPQKNIPSDIHNDDFDCRKSDVVGRHLARFSAY